MSRFLQESLRPLALSGLLLAAPALLAQDPSGGDVVYFTVDRLVVTGDNPLSAAETDALLAPYLGEQAGLLGLQNAADVLEQAMRARGYNFYQVVIPPQRGRREFELRVLQFVVGDINVEGNTHFDADNIRAMVPSLASGETPDSRRLTRDLQRANRHPSKRLALTMRRSELPDAVDTLVTVRDESPHTVFLSLNNRGSRDSGKERLTAGYQYSNLFGLDQVLTASYTTSPGNWSDVAQYGLTWKIPFNTIATDLTLIGSYSDVDSGLVADFFDVTGQGTVVGAVVEHTLLNRGRYGHRIGASLFDKQFDNDVNFLGQQIGADVRSRPVTLRYDGEWLRDDGNFGFHVAWLRNVTAGSNNSSAAYTAARAGAKPGWDAWQAGAFMDLRVGQGWLLRARLSGQYAGEPLIAGEQFGLGGADSVRGFLPREASADDGIAGTVELWIPPPSATLQVLGFVDVARGWRDQVLVGEDDKPSLASAGVAMRWQPIRWLRVNLDWGYVLDGVGRVESGDHRVHFNLTAVL
ncbi:MAG: ShlB/FhaC/HecB family hemolysin secretion/activation protein [Gammaproteobacteria bacterium]|nr:ShlB/FhaC/HecB family hemolysin secretion/activation protein [Gammaproteobacteria bacterium]